MLNYNIHNNNNKSKTYISESASPERKKKKKEHITPVMVIGIKFCRLKNGCQFPCKIFPSYSYFPNYIECML